MKTRTTKASQRLAQRLASGVPWNYIAECTPAMLQDFELSQLDSAAALRRTLLAETDRLIQVLVNAEVARLLAEKHGDLARVGRSRQKVLQLFPKSTPAIQNRKGLVTGGVNEKV
jgi:hypothetical protein